MESGKGARLELNEALNSNQAPFPSEGRHKAHVFLSALGIGAASGKWLANAILAAIGQFGKGARLELNEALNSNQAPFPSRARGVRGHRWRCLCYRANPLPQAHGVASPTGIGGIELFENRGQTELTPISISNPDLKVE